MRLMWIILIACLLGGCVTETVDEQGNPVQPVELEKDLVIDDAGRIIARPTHIYPPDRIVVNGDTPTEREIRLLGVEGLPESDAPVTFRKTQEWLHDYIAQQDEIYVKPSKDSDVNNQVIYGIVYLRAVDEQTGEDIPGGYVNANMAMLSQGLVRIRDLREIPDRDLRDRMQQAEDMARREKRGLWSNEP